MKPPRRILAAALTLLLLAACGPAEDAESEPGGCRNGADAAGASAPELQRPEAPVTELVIEDLIEGCGPKINADTVTMVTLNYAGRSQQTGIEFDSSWTRGSAATFELGAGKLIAGWDQGLVGMAEGGRRQLTIPGDLAYGPNGAGEDIGPDDTLVFVIDLIGATELPPATTTTAPTVRASTSPDAPDDCRTGTDAALAVAEETDVEDDVPTLDEAATELTVVDQIIGCGETLMAGVPTQIVFHYAGRALSTGEIFESTYDGAPATFVVGAGELRAGWEHGLAGMAVGGRRTIIIPGELAFGEEGVPPDIGPNDTVAFIVDLIDAPT